MRAVHLATRSVGTRNGRCWPDWSPPAANPPPPTVPGAADRRNKNPKTPPPVSPLATPATPASYVHVSRNAGAQSLQIVVSDDPLASLPGGHRPLPARRLSYPRPVPHRPQVSPKNLTLESPGTCNAANRPASNPPGHPDCSAPATPPAQHKGPISPLKSKNVSNTYSRRDPRLQGAWDALQQLYGLYETKHPPHRARHPPTAPPSTKPATPDHPSTPSPPSQTGQNKILNRAPAASEPSPSKTTTPTRTPPTTTQTTNPNNPQEPKTTPKFDIGAHP